MHESTDETKPRRDAAKGGRPAKFEGPRTRITVTLPDRTLERLSEIGPDRAKAIVRAVDAALGADSRKTSREPIRFLPFGPGEALLSIPDNRLLRSIPWISLVETAPGRHLIAINDNVSVEQFEVALGDILDEIPAGTTPSEIAVVRGLLDKVRGQRRSKTLRTKSLLVVPAR